MPSIPLQKFNFKPFGDFMNGDFVVDRLYDVIGVLHQVVRSQTGGSDKKACIKVILSDECGAELDVTLWESYANQLKAYIKDNASPVVVLTHAWCRQSSLIGKLNVSDAWNGSKLLLNYDHHQTNEDHPLIYPAHLDNLLDKHFAFHVKYQPYYKQASIVRLTQDPEVLQMVVDAIPPTHDTTNMAIHSPDTKGKEIVTTESPIIPKALSLFSNQTTTAYASDARN
ncbi:hypothetical protein KIW84_022336 [Lathyrus oleraceus]|uniref:Uncharacterized protein n=1 Tax=Pisum sativum TaxID=3888 RepID=A0A9D4YAB8_PEA|nr:hypothetical protein KIW84_022336 [Pisum sativum]